MSVQRLILLVDDEPHVRATLRVFLEREGHAVREYDSATQCLDEMPDAADCLISDIRMPGMNGLDFLDAIRARDIVVPVVFITGHGDVQLAVHAMKSGAVDFIEKPFDSVTLMRSIEAAVVVGEENRGRVLEARMAQDRIRTLTPREKEVLLLLTAGQSHKTAARTLGISYRTIEVHRARIMDKLGADGLSDLVRVVLVAAQTPTLPLSLPRPVYDLPRILAQPASRGPAL